MNGFFYGKIFVFFGIYYVHGIIGIILGIGQDAYIPRFLSFKKISTMSVLHLTGADFKEEVLESEGVVLVDFWAPWCGPCQMVGPVLEEIEKEMEGKIKVGKVNVDEEGGLAQEYEIMSIPAVFVFKNGEVVERLIGAMAKSNYVEVLNKYL